MLITLMHTYIIFEYGAAQRNLSSFDSPLTSRRAIVCANVMATNDSRSKLARNRWQHIATRAQRVTTYRGNHNCVSRRVDHTKHPRASHQVLKRGFLQHPHMMPHQDLWRSQHTRIVCGAHTVCAVPRNMYWRPDSSCVEHIQGQAAQARQSQQS